MLLHTILIEHYITTKSIMKITQSLLVALGALAVADARRFGNGGSGKQFGGGNGAAGNSTGMVVVSGLLNVD